MTALVEPVTTGRRSAVADAATRSGADILRALGVSADGGLTSADGRERQGRAIVALPVGLGFVNEDLAEKAAEQLHDQVRHRTVMIFAVPPVFFLVLAGLVVGYLALIEVGKRFFYASAMRPTRAVRPHDPYRHLRPRAAYFSGSAGRAAVSSTEDCPTPRRTP